MEEMILRCCEKLNIVQFVGIVILFGIFYKMLDKRFEKIESKLENMNLDIKELRTSLNRMEGAFYSKECCMLKDDRQIKKAE